VHPSTQLLAWVRYLGNVLICGAGELRPGAKAIRHSTHVQMMTFVIG
jgi:hypothetical protein